ncbi:MAG: hypothetical protein C3F14_05800, partial [Deltaproteobacteria bacterium]
MVTLLEEVTVFVVTWNVAVVEPAATTTVDGTVAVDVLLLVNDTEAPPAGAGPFSVTVPVETVPPFTVVGLKDSDDSEGRFTVRVEERVTPLNEAEMVAVVEEETGKVVIGKVAVLLPPATVTFAGTVAAVSLLLVKDTTIPPAGADAESVTVPVEPFPPVTEEGEREREDSVGGGSGKTVSVEDRVTPPYSPEIDTAVEAVTGRVATANVALVAPAATVTDAGTVAAAVLSLDRDTSAPPAGAAPLIVTLPVEPLPPVTEDGVSVRETSTGRTSKPVAFETPPPGAGLNTATLAVPAVAMSAAEMAAVSSVPDRKVVTRSAPFHRTFEPGTKLLPSTVSVKADPPEIAQLGFKPMTAGTGLRTSKETALERPPSGFCTVTGKVPVAATSDAGMVARSCVADTKVVARSDPFHRT